MQKRCDWVGDNELLIKYHDEEWGVPIHDDHRLFEFLILEGFQAGLSWLTILRKRENYRTELDHFDPQRIAEYDESKILALLQNPGILRNKKKIGAAIINAKSFLKVQQELGSFDAYIWQFVEGEPIHNKWKSVSEIPSHTSESILMSKDLKERGFKFVGPTICYAFMQAVGMVNDHITECFRHKEVSCHELRCK
ncbi:MAG: DNA-3-methyladenine glycosylase I [Deltaproteobacteria bacterium]|nr:MAG: DNA-3-methyladenine glycosylase I [Deltaproteobacteria bacterium]